MVRGKGVPLGARLASCEPGDPDSSRAITAVCPRANYLTFLTLVSFLVKCQPSHLAHQDVKGIQENNAEVPGTESGTQQPLLRVWEWISPEGGLRQPEGRRLRARPLRMKDLSVWNLLPPHPPTRPQSLFRAEVHTWQWIWNQGHVYTACLRGSQSWMGSLAPSGQ